MNKLMMKRGVDCIQMQLRPRHPAKRRRMIVVLPVSFRAHDYNLVPEEFTRLIILVPKRGYKNFEEGVGRETLLWWRGETKGVRVEVWREIVPGPGFRQRGRGQ